VLPACGLSAQGAHQPPHQETCSGPPCGPQGALSLHYRASSACARTPAKRADGWPMLRNASPRARQDRKEHVTSSPSTSPRIQSPPSSQAHANLDVSPPTLGKHCIVRRNWPPCFHQPGSRQTDGQASCPSDPRCLSFGGGLSSSHTRVVGHHPLAARCTLAIPMIDHSGKFDQNRTIFERVLLVKKNRTGIVQHSGYEDRIMDHTRLRPEQQTKPNPKVETWSSLPLQKVACNQANTLTSAKNAEKFCLTILRR
jgi:hypothetical protein